MPRDPDAIKTLTQDQLDALVREGDFPESVRLAAAKVVVVMTQDWCPQWIDMAAYLPDFADQAAIFTVVYNLLPDFERIMTFKEKVLKNRQVPYVRYYQGGKLVLDANWMSRGRFSTMLG
jgi:hypothetical protein